MNSPDKIVETFLEDFSAFESSFRKATEHHKFQFGPAARGCITKARKYILEAQECLSLSDTNNETGTSKAGEANPPKIQAEPRPDNPRGSGST